jgi:3-oxoadipate enol-lactonase
MKVAVDGRAISYTDSGETGPPVVFVHGFPFSSKMWSSQVRALAPRRTVSVDLAGFGESDESRDPSSTSIDSYAREVEAVIRHLELDPVVLCGVSMGGYVMFALLRSAPDLVRALILTDTRAEPDSSEGAAKRSHQQSEIRANGPGAVVDDLMANLPSPTTRAEKPEVMAAIRELMNNPATAFLGALEAMKTRPDSTPNLSSVNVPTLVVVGEHDSIAPVESAQKLHRSIKGSQLVVIPDAGHLPNLEQPELFNAALRSFLDGL